MSTNTTELNTNANTNALNNIPSIIDFSQEIRNKVYNLLEEYDHEPEMRGVGSILRTWARNKEILWNLLSRHETFRNGQISFPYTETEKPDLYMVEEMLGWLRRQLSSYFFRKEIDDVAYNAAMDEKHVLCNIHKHITPEGKLEDTIDELNNTFGHYGLRFNKGQKASRIINSICKAMGIIDHWSEIWGEQQTKTYDQWFAQLADCCKAKETTHRFILSINPIDYLTMSFGNSWASCHTIDGNNLRGTSGSHYHGCYRAGTLSYMLDATTMIGYWVSDTETENPETKDKVVRCTFSFDPDTGLLVQGRIYPRDQQNSDNSLYKSMRNTVQKQLSALLGVENSWFKPSERNRYIETPDEAANYRDYFEYENPNVSLLKSVKTIEEINADYDCITIGQAPICITCGEEYGMDDDDHEHLQCRDCRNVHYCEDCGCQIYEDDNYSEDEYGNYYCAECSVYCDYCREYHTPDTEMEYVENYGEVCCYELENSSDFTYCEYHERWEYDQEVQYISGYGYVCEDGFNEMIDSGEVFYCDYHEEWECEDIELALNGENYCFYAVRDMIRNGTLVVCDDCGETVKVDEAVEINGKYYCADCAPEHEQTSRTAKLKKELSLIEAYDVIIVPNTVNDILYEMAMEKIMNTVA